MPDSETESKHLSFSKLAYTKINKVSQ